MEHGAVAFRGLYRMGIGYAEGFTSSIGTLSEGAKWNHLCVTTSS